MDLFLILKTFFPISPFCPLSPCGKKTNYITVQFRCPRSWPSWQQQEVTCQSACVITLYLLFNQWLDRKKCKDIWAGAQCHWALKCSLHLVLAGLSFHQCQVSPVEHRNSISWTRGGQIQVSRSRFKPGFVKWPMGTGFVQPWWLTADLIKQGYILYDTHGCSW